MTHRKDVHLSRGRPGRGASGPVHGKGPWAQPLPKRSVVLEPADAPRAPALDVLAVIAERLGPPEKLNGMWVWHVREYGRPCLVYLNTWSSRTQTVTTCDPARQGHDVVRIIELVTLLDLDALRNELDELTSWRLLPPEGALGVGGK